MEDKKYILENITRQLVEENLEKIWPSLDVCHCRKCFLDVLALTLNKLKPKYVTSLKGELYGRLEEMDYEYYSDLGIHIGEAVRLVNSAPTHDAEDVAGTAGK